MMNVFPSVWITDGDVNFTISVIFKSALLATIFQIFRKKFYPIYMQTPIANWKNLFKFPIMKNVNFTYQK